MATYQSVQSNTSDNIGTVTITKPVSLAVGDYMLAGIFVDKDAGATASVATPAGWTQVVLQSLDTGSAAIAAFSKIADAGDVAASNFTFTGTGSTGSMSMAGHIIRVTDFGGLAGTTSNGDGAASTTLTMPGITPSPAIAASLYVVFAGRVFSSSSITVDSVAIATSNPTWTERAENGVNGNSRDTSFAVYTATRTQTTATGIYTITYASTSNTTSGGIGIILHEPINGSVSPETEVAAYAFSPIPKTQINATVDEPTTASRNVTVWQNEEATTTEWVNEPL